MMGWRTLVSLLCVVAGLGAVLLMTDAKPPLEVVAETAVLDGRSLRDCSRLWWQVRNRPPIEMTRKDDGRFHLTEPLVDLASAAQIKVIVDAWDSANMRATPLVDDVDGRRKAGLEAPEVKLAFEWPGGVRLEVEVGDPGPLGTTRFLRRAGKIWEGGQGLYECLHVGLDDLRERQVFRHALVQTQEVRVEQVLASGTRETTHLRQDGTGGWRLLSPVQGRADPRQAQGFLTAVLSLRVDDFPVGVTRFPETEPAIVITVRGLLGEEEVRMWEQGGQIYGALPGRGVTFVSDNSQYNSIFVNAAERLRATILLPFATSAVEALLEVVIDPGQGRGDRVRIVREAPNADWRLVEPVEFAAGPSPCNELVFTITRLIAREFVDHPAAVQPRAQDPRYGLQQGRLVVSVRSVGEQQVTTLWLGGHVPGSDSVYACRADEPDTVALVLAEPVASLRRPWTDYCARQVLRQSAIIERLDLMRGGELARSFSLDNEGVWRLVGAGSERPEVGEFANEVLRDLVGQAAVDLRGDPLGPVSYRVLLMRRTGDELGRLDVFDRPGQNLVVRGVDPAPVGFDVGVRNSAELRALWK